MVEQHDRRLIFARNLPQHCKKAADLPASDGFTVEHGSDGIDDDQDRSVCADPGLDLLEKCSLGDPTEPVRGREPGRLEVGKMQVQILDRMRVDVTMLANAFDTVANIELRLFAAQKQRWPRLDNATQPVAEPRGHRDQQLHCRFRLAGATIA